MAGEVTVLRRQLQEVRGMGSLRVAARPCEKSTRRRLRLFPS